MAEYLMTGREPGGKKTTVRIDADSADDAVRIAGERGLGEIVLHTDDVGALYTRQSEVEEVISPREFLRFRDLPAPVAGFLLVASKLYRGAWLPNLLMLGTLLLRRSRDTPWGFLDNLLVGFLLLPAAYALAAQFFRGAAGRYNALIDAVSWGRWDEALRLADAVEGPVAPEELAFRKARALVGLGRVDEALRAVEPYGDGEAMPEWLYQSRLPEILRPADRNEAALAAFDRALELAPDNPTVMIDAAQMLVWDCRDARRAGELLAKARTHALSDLAQPFATRVEGLIRLEEGRPREAHQCLEQAFNQIQKFRHASPLVGSGLDIMHAELALACAACGDIEAARRHYRLALPRLRALGHDRTIARCEQALGAP